MTTPKSLDEQMDGILDELIAKFEEPEERVGAYHSALQQAKEAINQLCLSEFLECLPEKRPQTKYLGKEHSLIQGWNNAIDEMRTKALDRWSEK
jgi:hypothetical protein